MLHSFGCQKHYIQRLFKLRRARKMKAGDRSVDKLDELQTILLNFYETFKRGIIPERTTRATQICILIESRVRAANAEDMPCPKIPKTVLRDLLEWPRASA